MNFKKIITPLIAVALIFSSGNSVMAAQENPDYDTSKYTIVKKYDDTNLDTFGIQSVNETLPKVDLEVSDDSENFNYKLLENTTRPLYDLQNKETGEIVTQYATDVSLQATNGQLSSNNTFKEFNMKVYGTVYYIFTGKNGNYVTIDKVSFRWENNGRTPGTKDHSISVQQFGASENIAKVNQNKSVDFKLVSHGTVLVREWNWTPVFASYDGSSVAVDFKAVAVDAIGGTTPINWVLRVY
ncbi:hypothetical protein MKX40_20510 [Paenibacillus sp. FSL R5-0517]|uniref:hypothetical protein n=1 Tax=Paenibacillus sp. FSL R5-0517 TaxID=2921647 RepID=UPI0030D7A900